MSALRCSTLAREVGLDPLGTAGSYAGFLLVEWPLPWPGDMSDVESLQPLVEALAGTGIRLQGLVPNGLAADGRRVALYRRPPGVGFRAYERIERRVAADQIVDVAVELVRGGEPPPRWPTVPSDGGSNSAEATSPGDDGSPGKTDGSALAGDFLLCTHGRRDACCGGKGMALVGELGSADALAECGYRLSRTSHTGGHRFAPTGIVLPEGTMWAFLDRDLVPRIARREGPLDQTLARYRGCSGLGSPELQAVERAAFAAIGWEWFEWRRWGEQHDGQVRLVGEAPDGRRATWTATVSIRERPVPVCGEPLSAAVKHQREPVVTSIERSTAPAGR